MQSSYILLFQSTLPFPFNNGKLHGIRPSVPIIAGQPWYSGEGFKSSSGLGDLVFDFQYGDTKDNRLLWSLGFTGTLPTATSEELRKSWAIGPGLQIGKVTEKYVVGIFINHQWGGVFADGKSINPTTIQVFIVFLPPGRWSVASGPIITMNCSAKQWELPLNLAAVKTVKINEMPWKFGIELNYYLFNYDMIGPRWMLE